MRARRFFVLVFVWMVSSSVFGGAWLSRTETVELQKAPVQMLDVAVIGAGPSGLVAAAEIMDKGRYRVTVFEATDDVGGKVNTFMYEGKPYDMGAVVTAPDYTVVNEILGELGIEQKPSPPGFDITPDGELIRFESVPKKQYGRELLVSHERFYRFMKKHQEWMYRPGFKDTPVELFNTYDNFARNEKVFSISDLYRPIMVGCGYGYGEDMPAAYWIKLMKTMTYGMTKHYMNPLNGAFLKSFPAGWQNMWRDYASVKGIDVQPNSRVERLVRRIEGGKHKVDLVINGEVRTFDRVIVTIPHLAHQFMEQDAEEQAIFSRVKTIPYKTTLAQLDGFKSNIHIFPRAYATKFDSRGQSNDGNIVAISSYQNTPIYQVYQLTPEGKTSEQLQQIMVQNIERMGRKVVKIVHEKLWNYFPHFDAEAFKDGIPQRLIEMQGKQGIYYTGALMNFEDVEMAAQHGRHVARTYF